MRAFKPITEHSKAKTTANTEILLTLKTSLMLGDQGAFSGFKDKVELGGRKFNKEKYGEN